LQRKPRELTSAERERYEIDAPAAKADSSKPGSGQSRVSERGQLFADPPPGAALPETFSLTPRQVDAATEAKVASQLKRLQAEIGKPKPDVSAVRRELLQVHKEYAGTEYALQAIRLGMQLPSPFAGLDPAQLPANERFDGQPAELVAVLRGHG